MKKKILKIFQVICFRINTQMVSTKVKQPTLPSKDISTTQLEDFIYFFDVIRKCLKHDFKFSFTS